MQEYFLFPDKHLFLDLTGLDKCPTLGDKTSFTLSFELTPNPPFKPAVGKNSFALHAVPVINMFRQKGTPLAFAPDDHLQKLSVFTKSPEHYSIYSVDNVYEFSRVSAERKTTYRKAQHSFADKADVVFYDIVRRTSHDTDGYDAYLDLRDVRDENIKLDIELTCSNGILPERLGLGDIRMNGGVIPATLTPVNIKPVTCANHPVMRHNHLWRLLSCFNLNRTSLQSATCLKAILREFAVKNHRHYETLKANLKRIDGIAFIDAEPVDSLLLGKMYRGYEVIVKLKRDHFTGPGDMYLFASVLERFLAGHLSQPYFLRVAVEDTEGAIRYEWPMRFGDRKTM